MSIRGLTTTVLRFRAAIALAIALATFSSAPIAQATQRGTPAAKRAAAAKRGAPDVKVTRRYKPPSKRSKAAALSATKYANYKKAGLALLRKYSPETHFILGVGRSPVGPVSFLKELTIRGKPVSGDISSLAASVPASSLKSEVDQDRHAEFFRHFERFLPKDVLQGKRKVVLIDWVIGGSSVKNFKTVLEAYYKSKGIKNEVILSGFWHSTELADFDFVGKASDYGMNVSDGDGNAEFDGSHVISNDQGGRVQDLKPNAAHVTFRQGMRRSMQEDKDLDQILRTEFKHLLAPARTRKRATSTSRAAPALTRPTKSAPQAAAQP
jgi:hypothetical protein